MHDTPPEQAPGMRQLRFADGLEHMFRRYHADAFLARMRWSLLVAAAVFLLFALLDAISLPEPVRTQVLALRLGLIMPTLALAGFATYLPRLRPWLQWIASAASLVCGLGVVGIIGVARAHAFPLPYEGIILVIFAVYFLTGLRFMPAMLCGWVTFAAYLGMEMLAGTPGHVLLYNAFFVGSANLIGTAGCYFLEHAVRQHFLSQRRLQEMAEKDFLTGLLNRRAFSARAASTWRQAQREKHAVGVAMMDVDYFKRYNDHYGHAAGDETLRQVARVLGQHARRPLDIVARYGGEEFVGLWYDLSAQDMQALLERVRAGVAALDLPHAASDAAPRVSISIGLAYLQPQPGEGIEDALRLADMALYQAKEQGRDRVVRKQPQGPGTTG